MEVMTLARSYLSDRTIGLLFGGGVGLKTLERPWLNNTRSVSCIPEGCYLVKRDKTGRHQFYAVQDVEGRTNIEFHAGNAVQNSEGCILVGKSHNEYYNLVDSAKAINEMLDIIGDNDFILDIRPATSEDY